jgi:hypothetical protein
MQTGIRVDAELWHAYKTICGREKLRPAEPVEAFLRLVVNTDSALSVLSMTREAASARAGGWEAYARVLLDWYTHGMFWFSTSGEDESVEALLLDALKMVADSDLRRRIEDALIARQRDVEKRRLKKVGET